MSRTAIAPGPYGLPGLTVSHRRQAEAQGPTLRGVPARSTRVPDEDLAVACIMPWVRFQTRLAGPPFENPLYEPQSASGIRLVAGTERNGLVRRRLPELAGVVADKPIAPSVTAPPFRRIPSPLDECLRARRTGPGTAARPVSLPSATASAASA